MSLMPLMFEQYSLAYEHDSIIQEYYDFVALY